MKARWSAAAGRIVAAAGRLTSGRQAQIGDVGKSVGKVGQASDTVDTTGARGIVSLPAMREMLAEPDALPFRVRPEVLDSIEESLRIVPGGWQRTAAASDWALTAVWVDLTYDHKLGKFVDNPPFLTYAPG